MHSFWRRWSSENKQKKRTKGCSPRRIRTEKRASEPKLFSFVVDAATHCYQSKSADAATTARITKNDERQMNGKKKKRKFPCSPATWTIYSGSLNDSPRICVSNYVRRRRKFIVDSNFRSFPFRMCASARRADKIQSIDQKRSMLMRRPIKDE